MSPVAHVRIIDYYSITIGQQLKIRHITTIRAHGAEEISWFTAEEIQGQHLILGHLLQQSFPIANAEATSNLHGLGFTH